jgi:hypothetical protein
LNNEDKQEALSWLKAGTAKSVRYLAELEPKESILLVEELYAAGAVEVWAVAFDRNPPYESINTLIIGLPRDRYAREMVFHWAAKQARKQGFDAFEDYGQRHLFVWFD